jgi:hypothetical protein
MSLLRFRITCRCGRGELAVNLGWAFQSSWDTSLHRCFSSWSTRHVQQVGCQPFHRTQANVNSAEPRHLRTSVAASFWHSKSEPYSKWTTPGHGDVVYSSTVVRPEQYAPRLSVFVLAEAGSSTTPPTGGLFPGNFCDPSFPSLLSNGPSEGIHILFRRCHSIGPSILSPFSSSRRVPGYAEEYSDDTRDVTRYSFRDYFFFLPGSAAEQAHLGIQARPEDTWWNLTAGELQTSVVVCIFSMWCRRGLRSGTRYRLLFLALTKKTGKRVYVLAQVLKGRVRHVCVYSSKERSLQYNIGTRNTKPPANND